MNSFKTTATVDDASHLTLREPLPQNFARECEVIILSEPEKPADSPWTEEFFASILITDPAFKRYPQGKAPHIPALDE